MSNRKLAAVATKKKLIEAGNKIICEKGLTNTSVDEITKACGVSKGTFYTHFKRKEDIIFELSHQVFDEILKKAEAFEGDFPKRLEHYMVSFSEYIESGSVKLAQEWIRNVVHPDCMADKELPNKLDEDLKAMKELITFGIERKELASDTPIEVLAHTLVDSLYGQLLCWCMSDGRYSLKERTQEYCKLYVYQYLDKYLV